MKLPHDIAATTATPSRPVIELKPATTAALLRTMEAGWGIASQASDVNAHTGEVVMTERLRDGMRRALNAGDLPWGKSVVVLPGTESRSRPDVLIPDGRTDIPVMLIEVFFRFADHDPHAIIECKRVAGDDAHLCREYVVEGIDRFRTRKYAENHATGFMAGYVIAGDVDAAANGVNKYLNSRRSGRQPRSGENLVPSPLIDESWAWSSRHPRTPRERPRPRSSCIMRFYRCHDRKTEGPNVHPTP